MTTCPTPPAAMTLDHAVGQGPCPAGVAGLPRLTAPDGRPIGLAAHLARHGAPAYRGRAGELIGELAVAGLTGRGGAAFPVHRKLSAVLQGGGRPVVVANGAEGEPASRKDAFLLRSAPHLVLDGLALAAEAVGAQRAVLFADLRWGLGEQLAAALSERAMTGLDRVSVELVAVSSPAFLAGEETALVDRVSGGPGLPRFKQVPVYRRGVGGQPTLVQNVETLAHIALIASNGAAWFSSVGTADEPGSMLCTVQPAGGPVRIAEVPLGAPLRSLLRLSADTQAVLCGGYHGAWLSAAQAARLSLCNADLKPAGAFAGAGVLAELPAGRCGITESARVVRYLALQSAGQCGPCFNGLPRIAAAFGQMAGPRPAKGVLADLRRWAGLVEGRGACKHPDGTVRFVRSALTVFAAEIDAHHAGRCTATSRQPVLPIPAEAGPEGSPR